jgi:hypothetical protein
VNGPGGRRDEHALRRGRDSGADPAGPRNFLAPGERRRLFWIVMPAGMLLLALLGWVERTWFPRSGPAAQPQVDTRLESVAGPAPRGDEVLIEREPEPFDAAPDPDLAASLTSLARVRDATMFRDADNDAWFEVWTTLREGGRGGLARSQPRDVSFRELFGQPRSFRGRLVRMKGTLHRAEQLAAPRNDYGIDQYWQCWMEPAGGPASPVVIQCLSLPEGMPTGMNIHESIAVTGYFFKNFAYNAADAIRVAPVIMTLEPSWKPVVTAPRGGLTGPGGVTLVVAASVAAVVGATLLGVIAGRRRFFSLLWCLAVAGAVRGAAAEVGPPDSLESFLTMKEIAAEDRASLAAAGLWTDDKERLLVRVLARLPAPQPLASRWRAAAAPVAPRGEANAIGDRLVLVRGRATFVAPRDLPAEIAQLAGWPRYDVVRLADERGCVVDVVVPRAPAAWPRWRAIDEPAEVVGLPLSTAAGPEPVAAAGETSWPVTPHDLLVASTAVAWHPATMLGRLGVDYGLFDTLVDDRKLEPGDTAAFWAVMAAATRSSPAEIADAAGGKTDVLALIDPAQKWFTTHRGEPVVIDGVARRATRIAIDDPARRTAIGGDHYWELEVFADTPTIKVNDRIQDRYPIVCCVAQLPTGMPTGESIGERVRVPGFGFKRYSYPLKDVLVSSSQGDREIKGERISTALVIAPSVEWRRPPSPAGVSDILFAVLAGILGLLVVAFVVGGWARRGNSRQAERRRRDSLPDRLDLPGE